MPDGSTTDRFPALNMAFPDRGARFRASMAYFLAMKTDFPNHTGPHGTLSGDNDRLPNPVAGRIATLITSGNQQDPDWLAANGDGWMIYQRDAAKRACVIAGDRAWVARAGASN